VFIVRCRLFFAAVSSPSVCFLLPLAVTTGISRWAFYLTSAEIIFQLACLVLSIIALAAAFALTGSMLALPCTNRSATRAAGAASAAVLAFALWEGMRPAARWAVAGRIDVDPDLLSLLLALTFVLVMARLGRMSYARLSELNRAAEPIVACFALVAVPAAFVTFPGWRGFDRAESYPTRRADVANHPNIVLITMDALAADETSLFDERVGTTPSLRRMAARGCSFTRFSATCSFTTPSVVSILTGQYPLSHRVYHLLGHVRGNQAARNLARLLQEHGYMTAAIVTNPAAQPQRVGLDESFDYLPRPRFVWPYMPAVASLQIREAPLFAKYQRLVGDTLKLGGWMLPGYNERPLARPTDAFSQLRDLVGNARAPFFAWLHLLPPHMPYVTEGRFRGQYLKGERFGTETDFAWLPIPEGPYPAWYQSTVDQLRARYHESIAEADAAFGEFLDWLERSGRAADTIVIVTADHGESFHSYLTHASPDLRHAELHVPMVVMGPGCARGIEIERDADGTDIAPTILDLAGIPPPAWMEGRSLAPMLTGKPGGSAPAFALYLAESSVFRRPRRATVAATFEGFKLTWYLPENRRELFDITRDPDETRNVIDRYPDAARSMAAMIMARFPELFPERPAAR
jgi:arylsulfatase A-like enzyme